MCVRRCTYAMYATREILHVVHWYCMKLYVDVYMIVDSIFQ